jgi:NADH:ubiquinone oxidoreductase subunit E
MEKERKLIIICNGKTCVKDGANKLLNYLQKSSSNEYSFRTKHCFGKCGNGPIVFILTMQKLYDHVSLEKMLIILEKDHLS